MRNKAYITGSVLKWSRETAKYSQEDIALKLKCEISKIQAWENESDYPTIKQAEVLSKIYRRPLAVFYLPKPPKDFQTLRDFRKRTEQKSFSTALTFLIRDIRFKQSWIKDFLLNEGAPPLKFIGRFKISDSVKEIAADIKNTLEIEKDIKTGNILKYWIDKVENKGIFVSLASNLHSFLTLKTDELRGFAISDKYAPFIFINSADYENAQLFTLVHELAHLWLDSSGVSNIDNIELRETFSGYYEFIEIFCNEITAEVLMPETEIKLIFNNIQIKAIEELVLFAKNFRVSDYAMAVRLLNLNLINKQLFFKIKDGFENKFKAGKEKLESIAGRPNPYILQIRRNSRAFTHLVYDSYKEGSVSGVEACGLINIKISNFPKLEKWLFA